MSEEIIKTLLSIMTPEQKAELISKLQDPDLPIENTAYVQEEQIKQIQILHRWKLRKGLTYLAMMERSIKTL